MTIEVVRAKAVLNFIDLGSVVKTELEKYDCAYEEAFADYEAALSRVNVDSDLWEVQTLQVSNALAVVAGSGNSAPFEFEAIDPASPGSTRQAPSQPQPFQEEGETAHLRYFDVTLNSHRVDRGLWGANVTVCYTRAHPGANSDGTTRASTDPWTFAVERGLSEPRFVPASEPSPTAPWAPAYGATLLSVGQCQTGWMAVTAERDPALFTGMRYAPRDFEFVANWRW